MNALVMYDHQTRTLWSHFTGDAISGELENTRLEIVPALHTTWLRWKELHPDSLVLDKRGFYRTDSYEYYYEGGGAGVIGELNTDDRLYLKEFVIGLVLDGQAKAYPFGDLNDTPVVNDTFGGRELVITFETRAATGEVFSRVGGRADADLPGHRRYRDRRPGHGRRPDEEPLAHAYRRGNRGRAGGHYS